MARAKRSSRGNSLTSSRARRRKHEHAHVVRKAQVQCTTRRLQRYKHSIVDLAKETVRPLRDLHLQKDLGPGKKLFEWMRSLEIQLWFYKHRRQCERNIRRAWAQETGGLPFPQPTPNMDFPSEQFMQEGIKLISDVFFFGALRHCSFTWKAGLRARKGWFGQAQAPLEDSLDWHNIEIDPKDAHEDDGTPDHTTSVIDTLLHECIHAFLSIYSCHNGREETESPRRKNTKRSRNCRTRKVGKSCSNQKCQSQWKRAYGHNGHGTAWLSIATHIGEIVQRDIWHRADLNWEYDMRDDFVVTGLVIRKKDITKFSENTRATVRQFRLRASQVQKKIKVFEWWQKDDWAGVRVKEERIGRRCIKNSDARHLGRRRQRLSPRWNWLLRGEDWVTSTQAFDEGEPAPVANSRLVLGE